MTKDQQFMNNFQRILKALHKLENPGPKMPPP